MLATRALKVALAEVGNGELGRNNWGKDVFRYRGGDFTGMPVKISGSWCAAFISYCYAIAHLRRPPFKTSRGAKRLSDNMVKAGAKVLKNPKRGAVITWDRGTKKEEGHVGICVWYIPLLDLLCWVDGNAGKFPSKVQVHWKLKTWRDRLHRIVLWQG